MRVITTVTATELTKSRSNSSRSPKAPQKPETQKPKNPKNRCSCKLNTVIVFSTKTLAKQTVRFHFVNSSENVFGRAQNEERGTSKNTNNSSRK